MVPKIGMVKPMVICSPAFGFAAKSTPIVAGGAEGPVTVALLSVELTASISSPNGDTASSAICTDVAVGFVTVRRPSPLLPRSACRRSEISCFSPAWMPSPLRMRSVEATAGRSPAVPENR